MHGNDPVRARTAVASRLAIAAAAGLLTVFGTSASAAAAPEPQTPALELVAIDDLGFHDLPVTWFADAVVVPGDAASRSVVVRNDRADPTRVSVDLSDLPATDRGLIDDLTLTWGDTAVDAAALSPAGTTVLEPVLLAPGEEVTFTLGYVYEPATQTAPATSESLTFTLSFRATADASDDPGSGDAGAGDSDAGGTTDDPLASTGGVLLDLRVPLALLSGGLLLALWGRRRRRRADQTA